MSEWPYATEARVESVLVFDKTLGRRGTWREIAEHPYCTVAQLLAARARFRELIKGKSDSLGFTPNDWATRALTETNFPPDRMQHYNLLALQHSVKMFRVKINGKEYNEPYPVLGEH